MSRSITNIINNYSFQKETKFYNQAKKYTLISFDHYEKNHISEYLKSSFFAKLNLLIDSIINALIVPITLSNYIYEKVTSKNVHEIALKQKTIFLIRSSFTKSLSSLSQAIYLNKPLNRKIDKEKAIISIAIVISVIGLSILFLAKARVFKIIYSPIFRAWVPSFSWKI
jgi:hypothetical protein